MRLDAKIVIVHKQNKRSMVQGNFARDLKIAKKEHDEIRKVSLRSDEFLFMTPHLFMKLPNHIPDPFHSISNVFLIKLIKSNRPLPPKFQLLYSGNSFGSLWFSSSLSPF